jgi:hypothetical protein
MSHATGKCRETGILLRLNVVSISAQEWESIGVMALLFWF